MIQVFKLSETVGFLLRPVDIQVAASGQGVGVRESLEGLFRLFERLETHEGVQALGGIFTHHQGGHFAVLASEFLQLVGALFNTHLRQVLDI